MAINLDEFWNPEVEAIAAPITVADVRKWESRNDAKFPPILAKVLQLQNGGEVNYSDVVLHPLEEIAPLDAETGEELREAGLIKFPNRCFMFASDVDGHDQFALDYGGRAAAAGQGPAVLLVDACCMNVEVLAESVHDFLEAETYTEPLPGFEWSEVDDLEPLFREVSTDADEDGLPSTTEIVVGRDDTEQALVVLTRTEGESYESMVRIALLGPLSPRACVISEFTGPDGENSFFALQLQTEDLADIESLETYAVGNGRWKSSDPSAMGATVVSTTLPPLHKLRRTLLGDAASVAEAAEADLNQLTEWFNGADASSRVALVTILHRQLEQKLDEAPEGDRSMLGQMLQMAIGALSPEPIEPNLDLSHADIDAAVPANIRDALSRTILS